MFSLPMDVTNTLLIDLVKSMCDIYYFRFIFLVFVITSTIEHIVQY